MTERTGCGRFGIVVFRKLGEPTMNIRRINHRHLSAISALMPVVALLTVATLAKITAATQLLHFTH